MTIPGNLLDAAFGPSTLPKFGVPDTTLKTPAAVNNNPGNLRGASGWQKFSTPEEGFQALVDDITAKQTGRTTTGLGPTSTLAEFFSKYAPPSENDTQRYVDVVAKRLGVTADTQIGKLDNIALAKEIAAFEDRTFWDSLNLEPVKDSVRTGLDPSLMDAAFGSEKPTNLIETLSAIGTQPVDATKQGLRPLDEDEALSGMRKAPGETRRAFMERSADQRKLVSDLAAINQPSTISATTGWGTAKQKLGNLKLMGTGGVLATDGVGGLDVGSVFRFGNQLLTPTVGEAFKGNIFKSLENFVTIGGSFAEAIIDPLVVMPAKLLYNVTTGNDYLLPEERSQYIRTSLANYAGVFLGLEAGAAFEAGPGLAYTVGRKSLAEVPFAELKALSRTSVRSKMAKGYVEGAVGGGAVGFIDAPSDEERANLAFSYALMAAPIGAAFELLRSARPGASVAEQAAELFKLKQYQAVKDADAAVASMGETTQGEVKIPITRPETLEAVIVAADAHERSPAGRFARDFQAVEQAAAEQAKVTPQSTSTFHGQLVSYQGKDYTFKRVTEDGFSVIEDNHGVEHHIPSQEIQHLPTTEFNAVPVEATQTGDALYHQFRASQAAPKVTTPESYRLPAPLARSAPRYRGTQLTFASDFDRAAYILQGQTKSKAHDTILADVTAKTGLTRADIVAHGSRIKTELKRTITSNEEGGFHVDALQMPTSSALFNEADWTLHDHAPGPESFDSRVLKFAQDNNIPASQVEALSRFLQDKLGEDARKKSLFPEENALYNSLVHENTRTPSDNLVDLATASGMYVENHGGGITLRDIETDKIMVRVSSPARAKEFLRDSGAGSGPELDSGGPIPPAGIARGVSRVPPPPNGPHGSEYNFLANGPLRQLTNWMNTTWIGLHTTRMRQIMTSLDSQLGTRFFAEVWYPLNRAFTERNADMHPDVKRLAGNARIARSFTPEEYEHATSLMETMSPEDMPKAGGLFPRAFTQHEIETAEWFNAHNIDIRKAFGYRRALKKLGSQLEGEEFAAATVKLKEVMGMDVAHERAANIINTVLLQDRPDELSIFGITRLANAMMHHELSPADYIKANKLSPLVVKFVELMKEHYKDLGKKGDIPEEAMMNGYFPHYRNYGDDPIVTRKNGVPVFVSDLLRTGEMSEYDRDPISVMMRYITTLANNKHIKSDWANAIESLDQGTRGMGDNGRTIKDMIRTQYMDKLRGVPHDNTKLSQSLFDGMLERLGVKVSVDTKKDLTNTALSISSAAVMGARLSQGARDMQNIVSVFYSRFGASRTSDMLTQVSKWTPEMLMREGIIERAVPGESVSGAMAREGVSPTLSPIATQSAEERAQAGISERVQASAARDFISKMADNGIKWGGQHNVYQWGHAAAYLEGRSFTSKVLTEMMRSDLKPEAAKAAAYKKLKIDTYDLPVAQEFDRMVKAGQFEQSADFMGHANSYETISLFGYGDTPVGWNTNGGRLLAQLGSWSVWSRSQIGRMMSRGSTADRVGAMTRFAMTQTATKLASAATGLNLSSWYLPFAAPLFASGQSLSDAYHEFDTDKKLSLVKAALLQATVGEVGSGLFAGGPAASVLQAAVQLGRTDKMDSDALRQLGRSWMLGFPFSYFVKDIYDATKMAQQGVNPINIIARAFGTRSNTEPSPLNPFGVPR